MQRLILKWAWQARLILIRLALRAIDGEIAHHQAVHAASTRRIAVEIEKRQDGLIAEAEAREAIRILSAQPLNTQES